MSKIRVYRLVKTRLVSDAFTGDGARIYGGRWNSKGKACVYCAGSESLAILEVFVHIEDYSLLKSYSLLELELSKLSIKYLETKALPECWQNQPAPPETAYLGDSWLDSCHNLVLGVPSVIVPREWNYILNTRHPAFQTVVSKAKQLSFSPDSRLMKHK